MKAARILMAAGILASAAAAAGQVRRTQYGRALDANFLIGSGGINNINPRRYLPGNLYITGQVTRGRHFRGELDYAASNQLSLVLPSAGLDDFRRDSFSLDQLGRVSPYRPSAYLSRSRTVVSPRGIDHRLNVPGSSRPRLTYVPPEKTQQLFDWAVQAYKPIIPDMGKLLQVDARLYPMAATGVPTLISPTAQEQTPDRGVARPAASTVFGVLREKDQQRLAEELSEAERARRLRSVDGSVEAQVDVKPVDSDPLTGQPKPPDGADLRAGQGEEPDDEPGQDVYLDLLRIMRKMAQPPPGDETPGDGDTEAKPRRLPFGDGADARPPLPRPRKRALRRTKDKLTIFSLAGASHDLFNLHMQRAELLLAKGKFYEAAEQYRLAVLLNRSNPLASLGAALALFGANETLSAGLHLKRCLSRFPPMMETSVDVAGLLGETVLTRRIDQLEARIAAQGDEADPSLVFLAAFVRASMGQADRAAKHARKLASMAGDVALYKVYAQHLLKPPPPKAKPTPATAPAKAG